MKSYNALSRKPTQKPKTPKTNLIECKLDFVLHIRPCEAAMDLCHAKQRLLLLLLLHYYAASDPSAASSSFQLHTHYQEHGSYVFIAHFSKQQLPYNASPHFIGRGLRQLPSIDQPGNRKRLQPQASKFNKVLANGHLVVA